MSTPNSPQDPGHPPLPHIPPPPAAPRPVVVQSLSPNSASVAVPVVPVPTGTLPPAPHIPVAPQDYAYQESYAPHGYAPEPPPKKNIFAEYWRKVGGGSLMISILVHVGIIALAIILVTTQIITPKTDFLPGGGSKGAAEASSEVTQQVQQKRRSAMAKTAPMRKVVSQSTTSNISLPDVPLDSIDVPEVSSLMGGAVGSSGFGASGSGGGFGNGKGIGGQSGFTTLPPTLKARCNAAERLTKLKESGGTPECEKAVSNALAYFKTKQKEDGSWGTSAKPAMTGLTLLCYLGRCETPESPFYGDNVMKGIMYLIELSKKNPEGYFTEKPEVISSAYEHGIATYALGEMYSLARLGNKSLPGMKEAFEKGVRIVIEGQNDSGGWDYYLANRTKGNPKSARNDLSVTGWQYQALKAAKLSGLKFDGLHTAIDKAVKYLEKAQTKDGGIGAMNREQGYNQWDLTGAGVLGLQTLGHGKSTSIKKAIKFAYDMFQKEPPDWNEAKLYDWYYYAQAFFQNGGPEWKFWNDSALPLILQHQNPDGSWKSSGKGVGANSGGDNIYATAQCTLMLEVYYRYLKVGDREETSIFAH